MWVDVPALVVAVQESVVDLVAHTAAAEAAHSGILYIATACRMAEADLGASGLYCESELGFGV